MRTIRASEIGTYLFCARAWWYRRNNTPSLNEGIMQEGTLHHEQHGARVGAAGLVQRAGAVQLLAALILIVVGITMLLLP